MAAWPTDLQQYLLAEGFSMTPADNVITSDVEAGVPKKRRRFTKTKDDVTGNIHLPYDKYDVLDIFYKVTTASGVLPFDVVHPITKVPVKARFAAPPTYAPLGGLVFLVSLKWEILPG